MSMLKRLDDALIAVVNLMILISSVAMSLLVFFLIMSRYFFGSSMIGVLELATVAALWLYMFGAILSSRNNDHLTVDFLEKAITNPKQKAAYDLLRSILVLFPAIFMLFLARDMLNWGIMRPQTTPSLGIPLLVQQGPMLAASVFFTAYALRDILRAVAQLKLTNSEGA
ncbi:TRAP transporter small permease subunit [Roseovarius aestuarii]|nr:TRAP transporter small permease subunit [Roseovarius aestuarii]